MANRQQRLIDANALLAEVVKAQALEPDKAIAKIITLLTEAESVDAVEVVHGRWIYEPVEFTYEKDIKCSVCGSYAKHASNYCPNCGAKMDGEGSETDGN